MRTYQIDMFGAVNPRLEFWYWHDPATTNQANSFTTVSLIEQGATKQLNVTYTENGVKKQAERVEKNGSYMVSPTLGWKQYTIDLYPYTTTSCVIIQFESVNRGGSEQYMDHILITSDQDLAVSEIYITPEATLCDMKNKKAYVVLSTTANQVIDFGKFPTTIALQSPKGMSYYTLNSGMIDVYSSDTFLLDSNINLSSGSDNNFKAWLTTSVDAKSSNDTANFAVSIKPALEVTIEQMSTPTTNTGCFPKLTQAMNKVWVKNSGNVTIDEIYVIMEVSSPNSALQTFSKTVSTSLDSGETVLVEFDRTYTVPSSDQDYIIGVTAYTACDLSLAKGTSSIQECVDLDDLELSNLSIAPNTAKDTTGKIKTITVKLNNIGVGRFDNVVAVARIEDATGVQIPGTPEISETIADRIFAEDTVSYTFAGTYTVPNVSEYTLRVFLNRKDNFNDNDTVELKRQVENATGVVRNVNANLFTLEQNVPNPVGRDAACHVSTTAYSIPEAGEIIFNVLSASGQVLYSKVIQAEAGKHSVELNTGGFAAGVYVYSMEYKGQKLVKKMSITQ